MGLLSRPQTRVVIFLQVLNINCSFTITWGLTSALYRESVSSRRCINASYLFVRERNPISSSLLQMIQSFVKPLTWFVLGVINLFSRRGRIRTYARDIC